MPGKILICIYSCQKNTGTRLRAIRNTWLKNLPPTVDYRIFYGGLPPQSMEADEVLLNCPDTYETLPLKTWALLHYCHENFSFDTLIKVDDDVFVKDIPKWLDSAIGGDYVGKMESRPPSSTYHYPQVSEKFRVPIPEELLNYPFALGSTYALSWEAVQLFCSLQKNDIAELSQPVGYEDVMMGNVMRNREAIRWVDYSNFVCKSFGIKSALRGLIFFLAIDNLKTWEMYFLSLVNRIPYPVLRSWYCRYRLIRRRANRFLSLPGQGLNERKAA